jgi:hypothetical protein
MVPLISAVLIVGGRMPVREVQGWVCAVNVRTAMEYLSRWVGYEFDDWDWQAIEFALPGTSWDEEKWYDYPIVGSPALTVLVAHSPDADPVGVRVRGDIDDILQARIETLLLVLANVRPG